MSESWKLSDSHPPWHKHCHQPSTLYSGCHTLAGLHSAFRQGSHSLVGHRAPLLPIIHTHCSQAQGTQSALPLLLLIESCGNLPCPPATSSHGVQAEGLGWCPVGLRTSIVGLFLALPPGSSVPLTSGPQISHLQDGDGSHHPSFIHLVKGCSKTQHVHTLPIKCFAWGLNQAPSHGPTSPDVPRCAIALLPQVCLHSPSGVRIMGGLMCRAGETMPEVPPLQEVTW